MYVRLRTATDVFSIASNNRYKRHTQTMAEFVPSKSDKNFHVRQETHTREEQERVYVDFVEWHGLRLLLLLSSLLSWNIQRELSSSRFAVDEYAAQSFVCASFADSSHSENFIPVHFASKVCIFKRKIFRERSDCQAHKGKNFDFMIQTMRSKDEDEKLIVREQKRELKHQN